MTQDLNELSFYLKPTGGSADGLEVRSLVQKLLVVALAAGTSGVLAGCNLLLRASTFKHDKGPSVASVAGFTRVATNGDYIVVVNILPSEEMFTKAQVERDHPQVGEMTYDSVGAPVGPTVRHVEAHIYAKATGLPIRDKAPVITVIDHTSGKQISVPSKLMSDVVVGESDIHFGDNVNIPGNRDLTVKVQIDGMEVSVDGHLD